MITIPKTVLQSRRKTRVLRPVRKSKSVENNYYNDLKDIIDKLELLGLWYTTAASTPQNVVDKAEEDSNKMRKYVERIAPILALRFVTKSSKLSKDKLETVVAQSFSVPRETVNIVEKSLATEVSLQRLRAITTIEDFFKDIIPSAITPTPPITARPSIPKAEIQEPIEATSVATIEEGAILQNVQLIKTIPERYFNSLVEAVTANFYGRPQKNGAKDLKDRIQQIGQITKNHAAFIARDQTAKLSAHLTRVRQENIGVTKYRWRNSRDRRVVGNPHGLYPKGNYGHGDHWHREGKTYSYKKPPHDGNPADAYNCRCYAEAIINLDELNIV